MDLSKIISLIEQDDLDKARSGIHNLLDNTSLSDEQRVEAKIYLARIHLLENDNQNALDLINDALSQTKDDSNLYVYAIITKSDILNNLNEYKQALETLDTITSNLSDNIILKSQYHYVKGQIYINTGDLEKSIECITEAIENTGDNHVYLQCQMKSSLSAAYYQMGNLELGIEIGIDNIEACKSYGFRRPLARTYGNMGAIHVTKGNLDEALEYFNSSLDIYQNLYHDFGMALQLNNIGAIYHYKGNLKDALKYYKLSLNYRLEIGDEKQTSMSYINLAELYEDRGELDLAFIYAEKALDIDRDLGNEIDISNTLNILGSINFKLQNYTDAVQNFHESLEMSRKIGNPTNQSLSLFELININILSDNIQQAEDYFNDLKALKENNVDNKIIQFRFDFSHAQILKTKNRMKYKIQSLEILEKIIENTIDKNLSILAIFSVCEILIEELEKFGNAEIVEEIKEWLGRLSVVVRKQGSYSVLVQIYLIHSKLDLIEGKIHQAKSKLNNARLFAESKDHRFLVTQINEEYEILLNEFETWSQLYRDESLGERVKKANLSQTMSKIISNQWNKSLFKEIPILFLILTRGGITPFSHKFYSAKIDENLIGSFITAINTFAQELFASEGSIEKIQHEEYTISMKVEQNTGLVFCYIYRGYSQNAVEKIEAIANNLKNNPSIWKNLSDNPHMISDTLNKNIDKVILQTFSATKF